MPAGQAAAARCSRSRTPSHSGVPGGVSTQISSTPCGVELAQHREQLRARLAGVVGHAPQQRRAASALRSDGARLDGDVRARPRPARRAPSAAPRASISRTLALRRVVRFQRAGGARARRASVVPVAQRLAAGRLDLRARERARAQQHRRAAACSRRWSIRCRPRRRRRRAPAGRRRTRPAHARGGRADAAEAVGAGRRPGPRTPGCGAGRAAAPAPPDARGSAGRSVSCPPAAAAPTPAPARQDQRQRAGPEGLHQPLRERRQRLRRSATAPRCRVPARRARSADGRWAGPWPRRSAPPPRRWPRRRPGRRRSRSERRPGRRRASTRAACVDGLGRRGRRRIIGRRALRTASMPQQRRAARCEVGRAAHRLRCRSPVMVRWPILRPRPRLGLAVQVQVRAGQRQHVGPGRRRAALAPSASNHRSPSRLSMTAGLCWRGGVSGRPASVRTCSSNCETSQASMRPVAAVVRARRHLVDDQRAVVQHEELDAQHADVVQALGDRLGAASTARCGQRRRAGCRRCTSVTARMPSRCRLRCGGKCTIWPSRAARDDHRAFDRPAAAASPARRARCSSAVPGRGQLGARGHALLALAVVAQARGLQDAGQQVVGHGGQLRRRSRSRHSGAQAHAAARRNAPSRGCGPARWRPPRRRATTGRAAARCVQRRRRARSRIRW